MLGDAELSTALHAFPVPLLSREVLTVSIFFLPLCCELDKPCSRGSASAHRSRGTLKSCCSTWALSEIERAPGNAHPM